MSDYITTAESAHILGVSLSTVKTWMGHADKSEARGRGKTNLYSAKRVAEVKAARKPRKRPPPHSIVQKRCPDCGEVYSVKPYQPRCDSCKQANKNLDIWKIMVRPQFRGRKCPTCGVPVETGRYRCARCTANSPSRTSINSECDFGVSSHGF